MKCATWWLVVVLVCAGATVGWAAEPGGGQHPSGDKQWPKFSANPTTEVLPRLTDARISESSGIAVHRSRAFTVNDSGTAAVVFVVDPATGNTTGTITYAEEKPQDTEAVALGPDGALWVADIGDNYYRRASLQLYRIDQPDLGSDQQLTARRVDFQYPGGARHDAETLLIHPVTGQMYVVTKDVSDGKVYALPQATNGQQTVVAAYVAPMHNSITDGVFDPSGQFVYLRTTNYLTVHRYPSFHRIATVPLPAQSQAEGVGVYPDGSLLLSSEGSFRPLLKVTLPDQVQRAMATPTHQLPGVSANQLHRTMGRNDRLVYLLKHGFLKHPWYLKALVAVGALAVAGFPVAAFFWWLRRRRQRPRLVSRRRQR